MVKDVNEKPKDSPSSRNLSPFLIPPPHLNLPPNPPRRTHPTILLKARDRHHALDKLARRQTHAGCELPFNAGVCGDAVAAGGVEGACVCGVGVAHFGCGRVGIGELGGRLDAYVVRWFR